MTGYPPQAYASRIKGLVASSESNQYLLEALYSMENRFTKNFISEISSWPYTQMRYYSFILLQQKVIR